MSTRDRALDAAHTSILEIGATRTTMVEIARRSGVGRTTSTGTGPTSPHCSPTCSPVNSPRP